MNNSFHTTTKELGRVLPNAINVSSYGEFPYNMFSPFNYSPDYHIPVPGQSNRFACSVESIWQGLKVIDGNTDFSLFKKRPRKRKGFVQGHLFKDELLDKVQARVDIYMPAYFFHVQNNVPQEVKDSILGLSLRQVIYFYDVESNLDINNPDSALAHSVFLADFFNRHKTERLDKLQSLLEKQYLPASEHETLEGPLVRAERLFNQASPEEQVLLDFLIRNPPKNLDIFHNRYYEELLKKLSPAE